MSEESWTRNRMIESGQLIPYTPESKMEAEERRKEWARKFKARLIEEGIIMPGEKYEATSSRLRNAE